MQFLKNLKVDDICQLVVVVTICVVVAHLMW